MHQWSIRTSTALYPHNCAYSGMLDKTGHVRIPRCEHDALWYYQLLSPLGKWLSDDWLGTIIATTTVRTTAYSSVRTAALLQYVPLLQSLCTMSLWCCCVMIHHPPYYAMIWCYDMPCYDLMIYLCYTISEGDWHVELRVHAPAAHTGTQQLCGQVE